MKTVIEMAREAGDDEWKILINQVMKHFPDEFERFAEIVRADERNRTWTQEHWTEYEHDIAAAEREECAKVCDADGTLWGKRYAAAIRARSNT